jgi:hypothetical protein
VVADVDGAGDELAAFRVGAGDDKVLAAHHVPLKAGGDEAVDVVTDGHEDFACEMAAFLSTMELVFEVDTGSTIFGKELRELDDC